MPASRRSRPTTNLDTLMPSSTYRSTAWMLLGAVLFAAMAGLTHAIGDQCDWLVIAAVRALVMCLVAVAMARTAGVPLVVFRPRTLWIRSLAGSVSLVCNFYAMTRLPVADVLTLTNMYPLWILVLSQSLSRRLPGLADVLGVACGILGVVLIERPDLGGVRLASGVAILGSLSTAVAMLGLHRLRDVDARAIVAHFAGVASLVALGWLAFQGGIVSRLPSESIIWLGLAGVALTGTFGQFCLTKAYASGSPTQVSMVGLSQVAFAMLMDVLIWGRTISLTSGLGFILVLAPTAWLAARGARALASDRRLSPVPARDPPQPVAPAPRRPAVEVAGMIRDP